MSLGDIIIAVLMLALVGVLVTGVVLMGVGGKTNEKYSTKLMVARIWLQALVLLMLAGMFFLGKN